MGIFYESCEVFNRTPEIRNIVFDGQEISLPPLQATQVPKVAVVNGMNQNPIMGSVDPNNPGIEGGRYLLGVVGNDEYPCTPLTKEEWEDHLGRPTRTDEQAAFQEAYGGDPRAKLVINNKGKKTTANNRSEAGAAHIGGATFSAKDQ